jgi:hypothetical protein
MNVTQEGRFELWLNPAGRDAIVRELQALSETHDHFHLGPSEDAEVEVKSRAYRPTDTILSIGKILFRTDEWDRTYFPHVMEDPE